MDKITLPKDKLGKVISDVERLVSDVEDLVDSQDEMVKMRLRDIKKGKIKGKSEKEMDGYLRARGVKVGQLDHKGTS